MNPLHSGWILPILFALGGLHAVYKALKSSDIQSRKYYSLRVVMLVLFGLIFAIPSGLISFLLLAALAVVVVASAVNKPKAHGQLMIFSNLEKAIASDRLSQHEKIRYLVFAVFLGSIAYPFGLVLPTLGEQIVCGSSDLTWLLVIVVEMIIAFLGIQRCYRTNKAIDNREFIERFVLLNFPVTIKFVLIVFPISVVCVGIPLAFKGGRAQWERCSNYADALAVLATWLYYVCLNRSFVRLGVKMSERRRGGELAPKPDAEGMIGQRSEA